MRECTDFSLSLSLCVSLCAGVAASQGEGEEGRRGEGTGEIGEEGERGVEGLKEGVREVVGGAREASELLGNVKSCVQEETATASGGELNSSTAPVTVPEAATASDPTSTAPGTVLDTAVGFR